MGELKYIASLLFMALFTIAVISFATDFGTDNNADIKLSDDEDFSTMNTELQDNMQSFKLGANESTKQFEDLKAAPGDLISTVGGIWKTVTFTLIAPLKSIYATTKTKIFGGSALFGIVITTISSFFAIVAIRYAYKTWFGRNPD